MFEFMSEFLSGFFGRKAAGTPQTSTSNSTPSPSSSAPPEDRLAEALHRLTFVTQKQPVGLTCSIGEMATKEAHANTPCLFADCNHHAICVLKLRRTDLTPQTQPAVSAGAVSFSISYRPFNNFPLLQVLATINDNPSDPYKLEALPFLGIGDVPAFFRALILRREVSIRLFTAEDSKEIASTTIRFSAADDVMLRDHIGKAVQEFWRLQPVIIAEHERAVFAFQRVNPL